MKLLYLGPPDALASVRDALDGALETRLALDEAAVDALLPSSDVVLDAYMRVPFPGDRLALAPRLRLFVTATTGADHIDEAALAARGVPLLTLRGRSDVLANITAAAEHSWLLLLACARRLRGATASVLAGGWDRNDFPGLMLRGRTLGVIGCGRIGGWVSRYALAFGMRCVGHDPFATNWPDGVERASLDELVAGADAISIHVPLNEQTRGLLRAEHWRVAKRGVIVVNTSRGEVLDEPELLEALRDGAVGAAGLDVLGGEPHTQSHPLVAYAREHDNVIITPHIGGFSPDALRHVLAFSCQRIREHLGA